MAESSQEFFKIMANLREDLEAHKDEHMINYNNHRVHSINVTMNDGGTIETVINDMKAEIEYLKGRLNELERAKEKESEEVEVLPLRRIIEAPYEERR